MTDLQIAAGQSGDRKRHSRLSRIGALFPTISGAWSEQDQSRINHFIEQWMRMLEAELREKEETVIEIMARLNLQDEKVARRIESAEYQALVRKTFRNWPGAESEAKRTLVRNLLANAAATSISSDDVVRMFIDWVNSYSELHFQVIGAIYRNPKGVTRGSIWSQIGKGRVREDSADADLYRLLFRDLSTGSVIRQHREVDYYGNFVAKPSRKSSTSGNAKTMVSAFDDNELYELTGLGQEFVHYAMTELTVRVAYDRQATTDQSSEA